MQVEPAMLRRLKLLKRLQDVHLSPEEGLALMQRVETNSCRGDDYETLIKVIRATTEVAEHLLDELPLPEPSSPGRPSPVRKAKRKCRVVKAARRRNRR